MLVVGVKSPERPENLQVHIHGVQVNKFLVGSSPTSVFNLDSSVGDSPKKISQQKLNIYQTSYCVNNGVSI